MPSHTTSLQNSSPDAFMDTVVLDTGAEALPTDTVQDALGATMPGALNTGEHGPLSSPTLTTSQSRITVLPRVERGDGNSAPHLTLRQRERYESLGMLGQGGVGEVLLVRDNDIQRQVAMKRIKPEARSDGSLLRFAEEIRTVGQLDHPNIVPIHDVGLDEHGHHFFIMKHVSGETLEQIIHKLGEGDAAYHERFTFEVRAQIFMELLRGLRFAHQKGIIHRDIKPANIIVGPFGEVTIMDWGLAKRLKKDPDQKAMDDWLSTQPVSEPSEDQDETLTSKRLIETEYGAILGTPAYLSPEQAQGEIDTIDTRSDIYSLSVLFYEFLTLQHYLPGATTLTDLMIAVVQETPDAPVFVKHPQQAPVPAPLSHFVMAGLAKNPEDRYDSIDSMMEELKLIQEGRHHVKCMLTFAKRSTSDLNRLIDRYPRLTMFALMATPVLLLAAAIAVVVSVVI